MGTKVGELGPSLKSSNTTKFTSLNKFPGNLALTKSRTFFAQVLSHYFVFALLSILQNRFRPHNKI
jgi:hypothetical protein